MSTRPYKTESIDLAAWLMAHGHDLVDVEKIAHGRHQWCLDDQKDEASDLATKFANSLAADVMDNRKRLISISRSGRHETPGKKG